MPGSGRKLPLPFFVRMCLKNSVLQTPIKGGAVDRMGWQFYDAKVFVLFIRETEKDVLHATV